MSGLAFTVAAKELAEAVSWVFGQLPSKPYAPVLGCVPLEVRGLTLTVAGYDGADVSTEASLTVAGAQRGRTLVSGRLLAEMVKTFPTKKTVEGHVEDGKLVLACGSTTVTLPSVPDAEYPTLPQMPPAIGATDGEYLRALIDRVGIAAAGVKGIPWMRGMHLTFDPDRVEGMATDYYRAASWRIDWKPAAGLESCGALVPAASLAKAAAMFTDETITIGLIEDRMIGFAAGSRTATFRLIASHEAPTDALTKLREHLSAPPTDHPVAVETEALLDALRRGDVAQPDRMVGVSAFTFDADTITIRTNGLNPGESNTDVIECRYDGEPVTVGFNSAYLADALRTLRSETAQIHLHPTRPVTGPASVLDPRVDDGHRHVVMPKRLP